jgi:hypothetical protein
MTETKSGVVIKNSPQTVTLPMVRHKDQLYILYRILYKYPSSHLLTLELTSSADTRPVGVLSDKDCQSFKTKI